MRGLICDDHPLMREALAAAMRDRWPDLDLAEAGDYPAAWAAAEAKPDFCLVDLGMPGAGPIEGLAGLQARAPDAVLLVITGITDADVLDAVRRCGVAGLFSKNAEADLLLEAIRARLPALQAMEASRLPRRQQEVLALLAEGRTNKEIGLKLGISPATVKIHVARLTAWLGAVNRTDAVARAQRGRII
ncbi:MAG: response regulator transcription factor [Phenylobacterium sp.]|uniref:response regulator transcription factor n=1 Tax=Phenylobacterium sp. TaxID=1871053 RepID=UPI001A4AB773|nr:response regulator transcription factor [Phenylobacterium sp.]MBL8554186.1 response regulator transcription factor [Phenylobacterium sp.]